MELSEYRGIKFNLNLNRYGTGNPEKFYAKIFLECSLTSLCIFFSLIFLGHYYQPSLVLRNVVRD